MEFLIVQTPQHKAWHKRLTDVPEKYGAFSSQKEVTSREFRGILNYVHANKVKYMHAGHVHKVIVKHMEYEPY